MENDVKIGLETHIELLTESKIFCGCKNAFGKAPNTNCCEICTGMPGAMPYLNGKAVYLAVKAGAALKCKINEYSYMTRKNYVYPDLPKAYQITQGKIPLCENGELHLPSGSKVGIEHIHIEEDAGSLKHGNGKVLIDYNRAGVPLIEIVTKPDLKSGDEVKEYLEMLALTVKELGISDCKMQEGSLRCDINISVDGCERSEVKNVNSYSYAKKAADCEIKRQRELILAGIMPERETRRYDSGKNETYVMRKKEDSADYRYLDEPDILPVYVSKEEIKRAESSVGYLPTDRIRRYIREGVDRDTAYSMVKRPYAEKYFTTLSALTGDAFEAAKLVSSYVFKYPRDEGTAPTPENVAEVLELIAEGKVGRSFSGKIFKEMFEKEKSFRELFSPEDFKELSDCELQAIVKEAIGQNSKAAEDFKSGKEKAVLPIIGYVMKKTEGRADAEKVKNIILKI